MTLFWKFCSSKNLKIYCVLKNTEFFKWNIFWKHTILISESYFLMVKTVFWWIHLVFNHHLIQFFYRLIWNFAIEEPNINLNKSDLISRMPKSVFFPPISISFFHFPWKCEFLNFSISINNWVCMEVRISFPV